MRNGVDEKLDRPLGEAIIPPVTNSSWAAAVVLLLKHNGTVFLCLKHKLTVI